jgi:hypothetical protein
MREALFALAGTALGILGTFGVDIRNSRRDALRERREVLRSSCAAFAIALTRMRQLCLDHHLSGPGADWEARIGEAHGEARAQYERLRLSADSLKAQEEARYALRCAVGLWRQVEGQEPRYDEQHRTPLQQLEDRLLALYGEVRSELGVPHARNVFPEPEDLRSLPIKQTDMERPLASHPSRSDTQSDAG